MLCIGLGVKCIGLLSGVVFQRFGGGVLSTVWGFAFWTYTMPIHSGARGLMISDFMFRAWGLGDPPKWFLNIIQY